MYIIFKQEGKGKKGKKGKKKGKKKEKKGKKKGKKGKKGKGDEVSGLYRYTCNEYITCVSHYSNTCNVVLLVIRFSDIAGGGARICHGTF